MSRILICKYCHKLITRDLNFDEHNQFAWYHSSTGMTRCGPDPEEYAKPNFA